MGIVRIGQYSEHEFPEFSIYKTANWKLSRIRKFVHNFLKQNHIQVRSRLKETKVHKNSKYGPALIVSLGDSFDSIDKSLLESASRRGALFGINALPITQVGKELRLNYLVLNDEPFWQPRNIDEQIKRNEIINSLEKHPECIIVQPCQFPKLNRASDTLYYHGNPLTYLTPNIDITRPLGHLNSTIFFAVSTALYLGYSPIFIAGHDFSFAKHITIRNHQFFIKRKNPIDDTISVFPLKTFRENMVNLYNSVASHIHSWRLYSKKNVFILSTETVIDTIPLMDVKVATSFFQSTK